MGRVVAIADGDTLTILTTDLGQRRVRLAGIDTPEKRKPFGRVAKDHLSSLLIGQTVTVNYDKRDHYGRIVGKGCTHVAMPRCIGVHLLKRWLLGIDHGAVRSEQFYC